MSNLYSAQVTASFSRTDLLAIEIDAPANTTVKIGKIRIFTGLGTETLTSDYHKRIKIVRESAAGTGGTSYTPLKLDANAPASACTVNINRTVGTISDTIDVISPHTGTDFYWSASDEDDKITIAPGGIFGIIIA